MENSNRALRRPGLAASQAPTDDTAVKHNAADKGNRRGQGGRMLALPLSPRLATKAKPVSALLASSLIAAEENPTLKTLFLPGLKRILTWCHEAG